MNNKFFRSVISLCLVFAFISSHLIFVRAATPDELNPRMEKNVKYIRGQLYIASGVAHDLGYVTASDFLANSLCDQPYDLVYGPTTTYADQILNSSELTQIVSKFNTAVAGKGLTSHRMDESTTLDSTLDLKLAYNNVDYTVIGSANNSRIWSLTIIISDTYDFDYTDWRDESGSGQIIAIMNDIGALAQAKGAIVPYEIQVTINTTMIERVIELNRIDPPTQLLK